MKHLVNLSRLDLEKFVLRVVYTRARLTRSVGTFVNTDYMEGMRFRWNLFLDILSRQIKDIFHNCFMVLQVINNSLHLSYS
jgi:hypothetical protein